MWRENCGGSRTPFLIILAALDEKGHRADTVEREREDQLLSERFICMLKACWNKS
jgi:hypothetical protein